MILKGIIGTKGQTEQLFDEGGNRMPVTHIKTSPCVVVGIKTHEKDGYWAIQLGFGETKNIKKPQAGLQKKAGLKTPFSFLKEIRFDEAEVLEKDKGLKVGDYEFRIGETVSSKNLFAKGDTVDITGTSKGKGFQGVVKRHGFSGGSRTHGDDSERSPGSIGASATPSRVFKGKKMAGRMGGDTVTIQNLTVVDASDDTLMLKGLVPGAQNGYVTVRSKNAVPEPAEEKKNEAEEKVKDEKKADTKEEKKIEDKKEETKSSDKKEEKKSSDTKADKKKEEKKSDDKKDDKKESDTEGTEDKNDSK